MFSAYRAPPVPQEFSTTAFPEPWSRDQELRGKAFWTDLIHTLPSPDTTVAWSIRDGSVHIPTGLTEASIRAALTSMIPWRKGPWNLGPVFVDCEWRSDWKWNRIRDHIDLRGKRVADVGCGNGYYLFRMLEQDPAELVGCEPMLRFRIQFEWLRHLLHPIPHLHMLPLGVEHLETIPDRFDVIFCMGVLYHRPEPLTALRRLRNSLTGDGILVLEGITLPAGTRPDVLVPEDRYAAMRNVFTIPTPQALLQQCEAAGFSNAVLLSDAPTTEEEQRQTEWMPYFSLRNFLDETDPTQTIEGYPAPRRSVILARK